MRLNDSVRANLIFRPPTRTTIPNNTHDLTCRLVLDTFKKYTNITRCGVDGHFPQPRPDIISVAVTSNDKFILPKERCFRVETLPPVGFLGLGNSVNTLPVETSFGVTRYKQSRMSIFLCNPYKSISPRIDFDKKNFSGWTDTFNFDKVPSCSLGLPQTDEQYFTLLGVGVIPIVCREFYNPSPYICPIEGLHNVSNKSDALNRLKLLVSKPELAARTLQELRGWAGELDAKRLWTRKQQEIRTWCILTQKRPPKQPRGKAAGYQSRRVYSRRLRDWRNQ